MQWVGVDPAIEEPTVSAAGAKLLPGSASELPFGDDEFDCVVFANVYEHIMPSERLDSMREMNRVLRPGGVLVG